MLKKVLFRHQDLRQLIVAMLGSFLGITFLVTSIHYLIKVNEFGKGADILGPNTLIVQKKVTQASSLNLTKTDFSPRELEKIKAEPFIEEVQPVLSNNFDVSFQTDDSLVPYFRSDVFIQTVDKKFLDIKVKHWDWKPTDDHVPMILPREFLVMLNTFMSANDIPQISDELAMDIDFKFRLGSNSEEYEFVNAKIIGFTNEVASILVPSSFMEYGNLQFGRGTENKITQIMISGKESEFGRVDELLTQRGLEAKNAQMVVGRLKSVVGTLFLVVLGISVIAVFLSGLVLIQYLQLLLSKNAYEVRTLLRLGYSPRLLVRSFSMYFIQVFGLVATAGLLSFFVLKFFLDEMFQSGGLYIGTNLAWVAVIALSVAYILFAFASYTNAWKGIRMANKG